MIRWLPILILALLPSARALSQATTAPGTQPAPNINITLTEEEKKPVIRALVTLDGKPLENVPVTISVKRTFGLLPLGKDTTLDDGTAVVPFPTDLPADPDGQLRIVAQVEPTRRSASATSLACVPAATAHSRSDDAFPRALWAPRAPVQLLIPIFTLIGGVWVTYAYVVSQIIAIRRGAQR